MNKVWMSKDRLSNEYKDGVEKFMQFAVKNIDDINAMSCPCLDCGNLRKWKVPIVRLHLLSKGFDQTYHTWIWHGENMKLGNSINEVDQNGGGDKNFVSQEPVDMVHAAYEYSDENPNELCKLLEDAEKRLYPGCNDFTKLSAIVKLYNLKAKYGWSDKSFSDLLSLIGQMLPPHNELPTSMYEARRTMVALGMNYEKIHACSNDCILYRKEYKDFTSCPTCGSSRWKVGKNSIIIEGIPAKVLWYFPPIPRFRRMFRNKDVSKELTWHNDNQASDGFLRHPVDTPSWKVVDNTWPDFAFEPRNLRLALAADGINPHSNMSSTYSCWPVILITYNLPPWLCMKRKFMMLTMLIAGPKQPGNDIDVYLSPLIEDLKFLWEVGVETYDSYRDETFLLRAVLLWTINDFPAYGNLSGCIVKGYHACPICGDNTYAKRLKHSRKMSFMGHRRFLHANHPYRKQKKAFDGNSEFEPAPKPVSGHEVLKRVLEIQSNWGKMSCKNSKVDEGKRCWKKKSIFFDLEYWAHLHVRHVLDVMHIEKNVCESIIGTLLNTPGKTKDGITARLDLVEMKVRTELAPKIGDKKTFLPPACYTLSKDEKRKVCSSLMGMKVPTGYSSNVKNLVSMKELRLTGLKSHDCHTLMQQLLPVAIRGVLPYHVRHTITRLCFFFNAICTKVIEVSKLDELQREVVTTLCLLEKYFPPSFFDIMVHLIVHLVREAKLCGPVWYRWMYPFERYMKVLKGYVRNRNRPEGCIAECYIAEEALEFCSNYLSSLHTIGIPSSHKQVDSTRPLSAVQVCDVNLDEWTQAHRHVLANDIEIDPYISEHMAVLRAAAGRKNKSEKHLQDEHNKTFIAWLHDRVASEINHSGNHISSNLMSLANGPNRQVFKYSSYMIGGVTYHTKERDSVRVVQNSGVSLVAKTMQVATAKDKNPIITDMEFFGVIQEIWELEYHTFRIPVFKCDWVDNNSGVKVDELGFTLVNLVRIGFKSDQFILGSQAKQVFYIEDSQDPAWHVVLATPSREYFEDINADQLEESINHHQCFTKRMPTWDDDGTDDNESSCIREDCDGIWVDN